jgi:hypothetical protein
MVCTGCGMIGADVRPNWQQRPARESITGNQWRSDQAQPRRGHKG